MSQVDHPLLKGKGLAGILLLFLGGCGLLIPGCGSQSPRSPGAGNTPLAPPPGFRESYFFVPGTIPPLNPLKGVSTPAELNRIPVLEIALEDSADPEVVVITMSGFYGGINNFRTLAYYAIRGSRGKVRFWLTDRRSNLLEDRTGILYSQNRGDFIAALEYYQGKRTLGGQRFQGFFHSRDLLFLSEWGISVHFRDLIRVIEAVRERYPGARVVYMGHSLGSILGELFAAYDLDCNPETPTQGQDLLRGLVLLDGTLMPFFSAGLTEVREAWYLEGLPVRIAGRNLKVPGVNTLREGGEILTDLGIPQVFLALELAALGYFFAPDRELAKELSDTFSTFALFLKLFHRGVFPARADALLGIALDDDYEPLTFARFRMGRLSGGPEASHFNPFAFPFGSTDEVLYSPSSLTSLYAWNDREEHRVLGVLTPPEEIALALSMGPTNFLEWYFPLRILVDLAAIFPEILLYSRTLGWLWNYGLCIGSLEGVRIPALVVAAEKGVATQTSDYDLWINRTRISDLVRLELKGFNHLDLLLSPDPELNPLLDTLTFWLQRIASGPP